MLPRERFLAALDLRQPDRVPHFENAYNEASIIGIAKHFTDRLPAVKPAADMTPEELMMISDAFALFIEELDSDGVFARVFERGQELGDGYFKDAWGITFKRNPHGMGFPMDGPVKSMADLKAYRPPQIDPDMDFVMLNIVKSKFEGRRAVVFCSNDSFVTSWEVRGGLEHLLVDYLENAELAHGIARVSTDYYKELFVEAIDRGADAVLFGSDLAFNMNTMMSPAQFDEFIAPYLRELVEVVHGRGAKAIKHSDGNLWPVLDRLIDIGFDGIHPIQPQCMDLNEVKEHCGKRVCLIGNIDCIDLLPSGSKEEVEEAVRQAIKVAAPGGGYILSSSNSIHPGCKPENYIAMVRATHKYGVYPIALA
jgi:uroporphyrinogen decarboxylase